MNTTPKFISFEGTEGVGKSTAIEHFCQVLSKRGIEHIRTREPGGSELGERLRELLLDNKNTIDDDTELLLMFTSRCNHLHQTILPALADGKWVICDRFVDSTVAYQGFGRFAGDQSALDKITLLTQHFVAKMPDVSFWLDLDIQTGLQRAGKRGHADRFESETVAFFERVYQGFCYQHQHHPKRIQRIDANTTPPAIITAICQHLCLVP